MRHALDQAVASIDIESTYEAEDILSWMKTWGNEEEQPLGDSPLVSKQYNHGN